MSAEISSENVFEALAADIWPAIPQARSSTATSAST
jgi:hypothetical protein